MADSLHGIDKRCIFRETFESEQAVRRNGGVPTAVTFNKGVCYAYGGRIDYSMINSTGYYSIRIKYKRFTIIAANQYNFDTRKDISDASFYAWCWTAANTGAINKSSGISYINGVASNTILNGENDFVLSGIALYGIRKFKLNSLYSNSATANADIELFEIYSGTLTADEVKNLYENKRHRDLQLNKDVQLSTTPSVNLVYPTPPPATTYISLPGTLTTGALYKVTINSNFGARLDMGNIGLDNTWWNGIQSVFSYAIATSFTCYIYNSGHVNSILVEKVLIPTTKTILDVSDDSGVIRNKYSGELHRELMLDPACETGINTEPWSTQTNVSGIYNSVESGRTGNYCISFTTVNALYGFEKTNALTIGKTYSLTIRYKTSGTTISFRPPSSPVALPGYLTFTNYTLTFTAATTHLLFWITSAGGTIWIDFISLKEIIPSVVNTAVSVVKQGEVNAMLFNGTTSKIDCGSYDTLVGDKTFIAWVSMIKPKTSMYTERLFYNGKFQLHFRSIPTKLRVFSDGTTYAESGTALPYKTITCIVVTRTSTGITNIYFNAVLNGTANQSSGTPVAGTANYMIGEAGAEYFNGLISSVRIINGILTAQEINQLYHAEKTKYGL